MAKKIKITEPLYYTVAQVAKRCNQTPGRIYKWIHSGRHIPKACIKRLGKGKCAPIRFTVGPMNSWLAIMYPRKA